jgi:hypothetical protein
MAFIDSTALWVRALHGKHSSAAQKQDQAVMIKDLAHGGLAVVAARHDMQSVSQVCTLKEST